MNNFRQTSIIISAVLGLTACAPTKVFKEASDGGFGYSETEVREDQYEVQFKMRGDDVEKATDFALLRAAELTISESRDWFQVLEKDTETERTVSLPVSIPVGNRATRRCGLLGCATTFTYPVGSMQVTTYNETEEVESVIYVIMGDGPTPNTADAYDARTVISMASVGDSADE